MSNWFEDENLWEGLYPVLFSQDKFDGAADEVAAIIALTGPPQGPVLDLCCGPGRHSIELALRGFEVTAVDRSPFLLDVARSRARVAGVEVEWVQQDMRDFVRRESFDLVLNLFTSFGYFEDRDDDIAVLRNVIESLQPGGRLLMEMMGKEILAPIFQPTTSVDLDDGSVLIQRHDVSDDWSRIGNEWIMLKNGQATTYRFDHTIYSAQEIKDRLEHVGFDAIRAFGDLAGDDYGRDATRLVVRARRPTG